LLSFESPIFLNKIGKTLLKLDLLLNKERKMKQTWYCHEKKKEKRVKDSKMKDL
jgi:hypothetical protein